MIKKQLDISMCNTQENIIENKNARCTDSWPKINEKIVTIIWKYQNKIQFFCIKSALYWYLIGL